jgi:hypothetical protein
MKRGRKPGSLCRCTCVACGAVEVVGGSVAPVDATGVAAVLPGRRFTGIEREAA